MDRKSIYQSIIARIQVNIRVICLTFVCGEHQLDVECVFNALQRQQFIDRNVHFDQAAHGGHVEIEQLVVRCVRTGVDLAAYLRRLFIAEFEAHIVDAFAFRSMPSQIQPFDRYENAAGHPFAALVRCVHIETALVETLETRTVPRLMH